MTTTPNADPNGQPASTPSDGPIEGQPQPSDTDPFKQFRGENGQLDSDKLAKSYTELRSAYGKMGSEKGDLLKLKEAYEGFYRENFVPDPNSPEGFTYKAMLEANKQKPPTQPNQPLTPEELNDRLREEFDADPAAFLQQFGSQIRRETLGEFETRTSLSGNPTVKTVIDKYPDVTKRVNELTNEGMSYDKALAAAIGEKVISGQPPAGDPRPASNDILSAIDSKNRTFMPIGNPPSNPQKPETQIPDAVKAQAAKYGITDPAKLEEFVKQSQEGRPTRV